MDQFVYTGADVLYFYGPVCVYWNWRVVLLWTISCILEL